MSGRLVLVRHGQTHGNVDRRLDTKPPGAELTELGREQARDFARALHRPPAMIGHSIATRAVQTAREVHGEISSSLSSTETHELDGIHEVQVGDLENRNDEAAIDTFEAVYRSWHHGDLDVPVPGGETGRQVLDRVVPVLTELRLRHLDDDRWHGDIVVVSHGAAIRLVASVLAGVDGAFAVDHHLNNTESVVLSPITDGRWSCVRWGSLTPPFYPDAEEKETAETAGPMG